MSSWETTALRLHSNVTVDSTPNSSHKSLPPLPKQKTKTRTVTGVKEVSEEEEYARTKGWKPLSLSTPILLAVIALTILLAVAIETLAQRSASQGGLALSPSLKDMPEYARLSYLYVPTIIAVLYSMIWSWIDLDVKRMQPWFELSKRDGVTAEDSLFLDYQYDFVGLVPFKAAKHRHWPVFFGGTAMVMVFWLLTPLQSALLGTEVVAQAQSAKIGIRSQLVPIEDQMSRLDPEFLNHGYATGWLGQPFPPFMTSKYALLPFYVDSDKTIPGTKTNWTAETTKLSTELNCWSADIHNQYERPGTGREFLDGKGCNVTLNMQTGMNFSMYYVGYYTNPYADYCLSGPSCRTKDAPHQFLAVWAQGNRVPGKMIPNYNITGLFCQTTYYKQRVLVKVKSSTYEPDTDTIEAISDREILTDKEFNSTTFEYLLANGVAENIPVRDYPFTTVVEQHPRLNGTGLSLPVSNMVGYALAGRDIPTTDYSSPDFLAKVYNEAHQYLFSLAVNQLLVNETKMANSTATIDFELTGVVVSRVFAICVESLLAVVALFTACILWLCRAAPSNLPMNPSSITRYIDIFRNSPELLESFSSMDNATEEALFEDFRQDNVRLLLDSKSNSTQVLLDKFIQRSSDSQNRSHDSPKGYYDPIRPLALRQWSGLLFVLALVGAIIGLSYLKEQEKALNGLPRPSQNFEVLQLLENYIPTAFATLVEPFWVLLNRLLCVLQPFRDLWKGKAKASSTVDATYTSIPPQLVLWRAIKSKHMILALVCAMALLANLLAVGLGSLFNEAPMIAGYAENLVPAYAPKFDNNSVNGFGSFLSSNLITTHLYQDQYYVAMANISSGTTLPPWVSKDYYFHRHKIDPSRNKHTGGVYNLQARGYGSRGNCTGLPTRRLPLANGESLDVNGRFVNATGDHCPELVDYANRILRESNTNYSVGLSAVEFSGTIGFRSGPQACGRSLILGWGRMPTAEDANSTLDASFMKCRPVFETAMFNLTVDMEGRVISYNRTSELEATLDNPDSEAQSDIIFQVTNQYWNHPRIQFHNDTTIRDWMSYLIMASTNGSRAIVDPKSPVPDPENLLPYVEDIYRRVFAIMLSLNEQLFDHSQEEKPTAVTRKTQETRIFMEDASFIITMAILAINTCVALLFYSRAVPSVLPRMPTTIGSVLAYVASSRLVSPAFNLTPGNSTRTFSFGRYIGRDKDVHIGIEMDPHVVPVDPQSLKPKENSIGRLFFRKKQSKERKVSDGTWL
ncbi:hypothetical protein FCULG_00001514 [Fusarium culmorum]|uniref:Uncharacterized protein n=1 Tax=Fusarium culmorum TaxID=5516 RepID=A0A2T4GPG2_FUSCU|nr:hypothetical protein FCULG_00001514 [Fusarium culmorum]